MLLLALNLDNVTVTHDNVLKFFQFRIKALYGISLIKHRVLLKEPKTKFDDALIAVSGGMLELVLDDLFKFSQNQIKALKKVYLLYGDSLFEQSQINHNDWLKKFQDEFDAVLKASCNKHTALFKVRRHKVNFKSTVSVGEADFLFQKSVDKFTLKPLVFLNEFDLIYKIQVFEFGTKHEIFRDEFGKLHKVGFFEKLDIDKLGELILVTRDESDRIYSMKFINQFDEIHEVFRNEFDFTD
jgi:hypothetical protein